MPSQTGPVRDLIDESFDEAAFLWRRWDHELESLTRNLAEVWSWTEDRLLGALDGVRVAGDGLVDLTAAALASEELDRVAVAAGLLGSTADWRAVDALIDAIAGADGERLAAIVRGLELLGTSDGLRASAVALDGRGPLGAGALCRLKSFRRASMKAEVRIAFESDQPDLRAGALIAIRHVATDEFSDLIAAALADRDATVRAAAVLTGVCRRTAGAWETALTLGRAPDESAAPFLDVLAQLGKEDAHEIVYGALRVPSLQTAAVRALGHIGTPKAVEMCIAGMRHEPVARACGEAYCWITGADLARDRLARAEADEPAPDFEGDDLNANLVPAQEALWPLPDADAVREHWRERSPGFASDVRHIFGRPATGDALLTAMEQGPMIRRGDLAFELKVKTRGRYDVETRAFAARQRQMMAAGRAAAATGSER